MKLSQQAMRTTRLTLVALCVMLSAFMVYEWVRPYRLSADPPLLAPDASSPAAPATPANRPVAALDTFSEITERPLFREGRRPVLPAAPTVPERRRDTGPDITSQISLSAIVIDEDERIALVEGKQDRKLQQLKEGEKFNGWTLNRIRADDITMQRGPETRQIALTVRLSRQQAQPQQDKKPADTENQSGMASPANTPENPDAQKPDAQK